MTLSTPPLAQADPEISALIEREASRQAAYVELRAPFNASSAAVRAVATSVLADVYASGYPGQREPPGNDLDEIERIACHRALAIFGGAHANVQPHSGTQANLAVMHAILSPGDLMLSMHPRHGGHVTHGSHRNLSGRLFQAIHYRTRPDTGEIDYEELAALAERHRPKLIVAGFASYPRWVDWGRFRAAADACGALLLADMAQVAGLVAAGQYPNPVSYADVTTTSTSKGLGGPRGGLILTREDGALARAIDDWVFPGIQSAPFTAAIAAKAVRFHEAAAEEFRSLQGRIVANARIVCDTLRSLGHRIAFGGTETAIVILDLHGEPTGALEAARSLHAAQIGVDTAALPDAGEAPSVGLRIGMSAATARGLSESDAAAVARWISAILRGPADREAIQRVRGDVSKLCERLSSQPG